MVHATGITKRVNRRAAVRAGGVALAGTALAAGLAAGAAAQALPSIVGSWLVAVPQPDGSTFRAAGTFAADGGFVTQFASADGQEGASLGCGAWQQTGERRYAMTFVAPRYDAATGATIGHAKVQQEITLDESRDAWSGPTVISFFNAAGALQFRTPPTMVTGTRVAVEPLP